MPNNDSSAMTSGVNEEPRVNGAQERRPVWLRIRDALSSIFRYIPMFAEERKPVGPIAAEKESGRLLRAAEKTTTNESYIMTRAMRD